MAQEVAVGCAACAYGATLRTTIRPCKPFSSCALEMILMVRVTQAEEGVLHAFVKARAAVTAC